MSNFNPNLTNSLDPTAQHPAARGSFPATAAFQNANAARQPELDAEHTILLTPESRPSFAWLIVIEGEQPGQLFTLNKKGMVIGRNRTCQIALPKDNAASSQHAQVYVEGSDFVVHDLASSNKTWVNGQKVYHYALKENDVITIGKTRFVFKQIRNEE